MNPRTTLPDVRSLRFLASRRWVLFGLVVVALAYLAWVLGQWQFGRLEDRRERNAVVERNEDAAPVPVESVLAPGRPVSEADEWRLVSATGTYVPDETVIVRYRTRDGASGVDVVVPLVTADGTALLVDRGWLATDNRGGSDIEAPAPPTGQVEVVGWVRRDATGASTEVSDLSTRAISSTEIGAALDRTVYGGFVDLRSESPEPAQPLAGPELPDLGEGPHFFYGLQWWFFGLLAIGGFLYLVYDEWRGKAAERRSGRTGGRGRSERPEHAAVDGQHHAGQE
jgi:cytochrome oxidase assembly protein ShyY1